jgi:hypothetical protein
VIDGCFGETDGAPGALNFHLAGLRIGPCHDRVVPWRGGPCQRGDATPSRELSGMAGRPRSRSSPGAHIPTAPRPVARTSRRMHAFSTPRNHQNYARGVRSVTPLRALA